ncbi:MAG: BrnT family toxin [Mesorhizobium sp.]
MRILWDEPKRLANLDKHGFDFAALTEEFFSRAMIRPAKGERYLAIGLLGASLVAVVFRPLGAEALSVISMRPANRKEASIDDRT